MNSHAAKVYLEGKGVNTLMNYSVYTIQNRLFLMLFFFSAEVLMTFETFHANPDLFLLVKSLLKLAFKTQLVFAYFLIFSFIKMKWNGPNMKGLKLCLFIFNNLLGTAEFCSL